MAKGNTPGRKRGAVMTASAPIAILGGGIMGCLLALSLARRGRASVLLERDHALLNGASRWNEGKIHLGYLYAASGSLDTARRILPGGLQFRSLIERCLEQDIGAWITPGDDHYLLHPDSLVDAAQTDRYFRQVDALLAEACDPQSGTPRPRSHRLDPADLADWAPDLARTGAWQIPEYSVDTRALADALSARILDDPHIEVRCGSEILAVEPAETDSFRIKLANQAPMIAGTVCNALWAGRPAIDQSCLGQADAQPHHRYRVSAFIDAAATTTHPSTVLGFGPFGDVKSYGAGRFYASWYPAGLLAEGADLTPPPLSALTPQTRDRIRDGIREGLKRYLPLTDRVFETAQAIRIEGGWVYARGRGQISERGASLHKRDKWGVLRSGNYLSIDTGKYSVAPWIAEQLAASLTD